MEKPASQIEKNVSASFGYVKKDMLMLNDAFSDLHEKVQQLSLNYSNLLDEVKKLKESVYGKTNGKRIAKRLPKKVSVKRK